MKLIDYDALRKTLESKQREIMGHPMDFPEQWDTGFVSGIDFALGCLYALAENRGLEND